MVDLFVTSLDGTRRFVQPRIAAEVGREAYGKTMEDLKAWVVMCESKTLDDIERAVRADLHTTELVERICPRRYWEVRARGRSQYKRLAYEHALELIASLKKRFITGGSGDYLYLISGTT